MDRASPNLARYCFTGKHIPTATLTTRNAGGVPHESTRITLYDAIISLVQPLVGGSGSLEKVHISFARMKYEYMPQSPTGGKAGTITALLDGARRHRASDNSVCTSLDADADSTVLLDVHGSRLCRTSVSNTIVLCRTLLLLHSKRGSRRAFRQLCLVAQPSNTWCNGGTVPPSRTAISNTLRERLEGRTSAASR